MVLVLQAHLTLNILCNDYQGTLDLHNLLQHWQDGSKTAGHAAAQHSNNDTLLPSCSTAAMSLRLQAVGGPYNSTQWCYRKRGCRS